MKTYKLPAWPTNNSNTEKIMKTMTKLLLGAVVAAFASTSFAAEPLLSPRAQGNQAKVMAGSTEDQTVTITYVDSAPALLSPRAQGNQIRRVAGTNNDPDLVAAMQALPGSPKDKLQHQADVYQIAPMK
jgi:hypothetical protein